MSSCLALSSAKYGDINSKKEPNATLLLLCIATYRRFAPNPIDTEITSCTLQNSNPERISKTSLLPVQSIITSYCSRSTFDSPLSFK